MNDVETVDTQLIAHKKEVYEIAYGGVRVFADRSISLWPTREEHLTIIYKRFGRICPWSASVGTIGPLIRGHHHRGYGEGLVLELVSQPSLWWSCRGTKPVLAPSLGPYSFCHIYTDHTYKVLIWDLSSIDQPVESGVKPRLHYRGRDSAVAVIFLTARLGCDCFLYKALLYSNSQIHCIIINGHSRWKRERRVTRTKEKKKKKTRRKRKKT